MNDEFIWRLTGHKISPRWNLMNKYCVKRAHRSRDAADTRLVQGVRDRTHRMINSQRDVGGWPTLRSARPRGDRDRDGMPDQWESDHDTDPDNAPDGNQDRDNDGYSNLEEYLNSLVPALEE